MYAANIESYEILRGSVLILKKYHVESMSEFELFTFLLNELNNNLELGLDVEEQSDRIVINGKKIKNNENCQNSYLKIFTQIEPNILSKLSSLGISISYDLYLSDYLVSSFNSYNWVMLQKDFNNMWRGNYSPNIAVLRNKVGNYVICRLTEQNENLKIGDEIIEINGIPSKYIGCGLFQKKLVNETNNINFTISRDTLKSLFRFLSVKNPTKEFDYLLINDTICYLKVIDSMNKGFTSRVEERIKEDSGKIEKIIIDLRGTLGGRLDEMLEFADLFLQKGIAIAKVESRVVDFNEVHMSQRNELIPTAKVIVLIDNWTSSLAEVVAGIVQISNRGIIIGEKSNGTGAMQSLLPYIDYYVKFNVSELYIGNNNALNGVGIIPDIEIINTESSIDEVSKFAVEY